MLYSHRTRLTCRFDKMLYMTKRLPGLLLPMIILVFVLAGTSSCKKEESVPQPTVNDTLVLFQMEDLPQISLEVSQEEWNRLLTNFDINSQNEEYIVANYTFQLDGKTVQLDSMGIRLRGNTSRRRPEGSAGQLHNAANPDWHHAHFALKFNKYRKPQQFNGLEKLNLKWFKDDACYVREVYCYDLFRRFGVWSAPRASYCRLTVHVKGDPTPAYFGVYAMIESIDEDFLAARKEQWGTSEGFLWKCGWAGSYNADFVSTASMGVEDVKLDPSQSEYFAYDLKTRDDELGAASAQLTAFINDLNTKTGTAFETWISSTFDVDLFLKTYAVNVMVGMWDDYWVNANNFYFYFAGNGKAYFIPYDYDNTLGTSLLMPNAGTQDLLQWGPVSGRPLITKLLAVPRWRDQYKAYCKELVQAGNAYFDATTSMQRVMDWQQFVGPYVSNDTGEDMYIEDKPAWWGNASYYRLLSGNDQGGAAGPANFFTTKLKQVNW